MTEELQNQIPEQGKMKKLLEFLQSVNGDMSSKRLAGLSGYAVFLTLAVGGALYFLFTDKNADFISVVQTVGWTSLTALGIGTVEHFAKPKQKIEADE